jgi:hypothetical protein
MAHWRILDCAHDPWIWLCKDWRSAYCFEGHAGDGSSRDGARRYWDLGPVIPTFSC